MLPSEVLSHSRVNRHCIVTVLTTCLICSKIRPFLPVCDHAHFFKVVGPRATSVDGMSCNLEVSVFETRAGTRLSSTSPRELTRSDVHVCTIHLHQCIFIHVFHSAKQTDAYALAQVDLFKKKQTLSRWPGHDDDLSIVELTLRFLSDVSISRGTEVPVRWRLTSIGVGGGVGRLQVSKFW